MLIMLRIILSFSFFLSPFSSLVSSFPPLDRSEMWRAFAPTTSRLPGPVASASLSLLRPFSDIASYKFRPKHVSVKVCNDVAN